MTPSISCSERYATINMSLNVLPPELLIRVLSCLPIQDVVSFGLISRSFLEVVRVNEGPIYQAAAALHGFIEPAENASTPPLLSKAIRIPDATGWLDDVTSWKEFCKSSVISIHGHHYSQPV